MPGWARVRGKTFPSAQPCVEWETMEGTQGEGASAPTVGQQTTPPEETLERTFLRFRLSEPLPGPLAIDDRPSFFIGLTSRRVFFYSWDRSVPTDSHYSELRRAGWKPERFGPNAWPEPYGFELNFDVLASLKRMYVIPYPEIKSIWIREQRHDHKMLGGETSVRVNGILDFEFTSPNPLLNALKAQARLRFEFIEDGLLVQLYALNLGLKFPKLVHSSVNVPIEMVQNSMGWYLPWYKKHS